MKKGFLDLPRRGPGEAEPETILLSLVRRAFEPPGDFTCLQSTPSTPALCFYEPR